MLSESKQWQVLLRNSIFQPIKRLTLLQYNNYIESYGQLSKDKPIPEWLAKMAFDERCNACEILISEGRIDPVINNTYSDEMYLRSVFDSEIKIDLIKQKKKISYTYFLVQRTGSP